MPNILKTCYRVIKILDASSEDRENLFKELAETGFTKPLKEKLITHIERDFVVTEKKLKEFDITKRKD